MIRPGIAILAGMLAFGAAAKPRVVSINMCTDQLVLALADDDQILGLSHLSQDPALSFYRARAAAFRVVSGQAEDVLHLKPDLIVTATFAKAQTRDLLARAGQRVEAFDNARTLIEARDQIRRMGRLLDQSARAEAAIARIDAALQRRDATIPSTPLRILPLERRGWVTGRDTLLTDLMRHAGYHNAGAEVAPIGRRLSLEAIIALNPDGLLLTAPLGTAEDQGAALLHHPALRRLTRQPPRVMPENLTVCAGPMQAEALERLGSFQR